MVSKDNDFTIFGLRSFFVRVRGTIGNNVFSGKYPMVTKSFKVSSVTVEGTQLQTVVVFGGMVRGQAKKEVICRLKLNGGITG